MKNLLYKEYKLCLVPMVPLFYLFALMLLIPSYPYLVAAFFTCNSIFYLLKQASLNGDMLFSAMLPVPKADVVRARVRFVVIIQMILFILLIPMILINHRLYPQGNPAGTDGSLTLLAFVLVVFTVFNAICLPGFFRDEAKIDRMFLLGVIGVFGWIILCEGFMIAAKVAPQVPLFAWVEGHLDCYPTTDGAWAAQLLALLIGALIYGLGTLLTTRRAIRYFEGKDL